MVYNFCAQKLAEYEKLFQLHRTFLTLFCIVNLTFSITAALGNVLVIRALRKASSMPATMKKMLLSLASSDVAMGFFGQPMFCAVIGVMLTTSFGMDGQKHFDLLCPQAMTISYFFLFLLGCASFLNVIGIAIDRLLAVLLHLRYQELVTSRKIHIALWSIRLTSVICATIFVTLPKNNNRVSVSLQFVGFLVTTVAYIHIYKAVRYHQSRIRVQPQPTDQVQAHRTHQEKESAINAMAVYGVFVICYFPYLCCTILLMVDSLRTSFLVAYQVSLFLVLLNSSLNPAVICWRFRELRRSRIVKITLREMFRLGHAQRLQH